MAMIASGTAATATAKSEELTPGLALRVAWVCWLMLLSLPFVVFLYTVWTLTNSGERANKQAADVWFIASMVYLIVVVPISIFIRSRAFRDYWTGCCVPPKNYLSGMLTVWITLEIGGIFSLIGCLASNSLLPNLLPALVAFMLFIPLWPSGRAMTSRNRGNTDDPETYEEPR